MSGPPAELLRSGDRQRPDLLQLPQGSPAREPRGPEVHQSRHWRSPDCHGPATRSREDRDASVDRGAVRGRRLRRVVPLDRRASLTRRSHVLLAGPDSADPDARADRLDSLGERGALATDVLPLDDDLGLVIAGTEPDGIQDRSPPGIRTFEREGRPFSGEYCRFDGRFVRQSRRSTTTCSVSPRM